MYAFQEFEKNWRAAHPQMNVEAESSYYYDIYSKIVKLSCLGEEAGVHENWHIMKLMTYIENMGHLALEKLYQDMYRLAEDDYFSLVEAVQFDSWDDFHKALAIVDEAVKNAPESALVARLNEVIVNIDFAGLVQMLKWLFDNCV